MTYTMCPSCGQHALKVANRCPRCGLPFEQQFLSRVQPTQSRPRLPVAVMLGGILVAMLVSAEWIKRRNSEHPAKTMAAAPVADTTLKDRPIAPASGDTAIHRTDSASQPRLAPPTPEPVTVAAAPAQPVAPAPASSSSEGAHAATIWVNVRARPSNASAIVGVLAPGEVVRVESDSQGWYRLEAGRVPAGYVDRRLLQSRRP